MQKFARDFFARRSPIVATDLLGKLLIHEHPRGTTIGRIVETEAYHQDDPVAHSYGGLTERNKALFGPPGTAYVYLIYGMHLCFNVATFKRGAGEGVLIRALEPVAGLDLMKQRRDQQDKQNLCSGPAKLTQAMNITRQHAEVNLLTAPLYLAADKNSTTIAEEDIVTTTRVGISKATDENLRFYLKDNQFVSQK